MRRMRQNPEESLDLLLDTLCNVFGGIILISCLLTLLTHKQPAEAPGSGDSAEIKGRLLAEKLDAAKQELRGLQSVLEKHQATGEGDLQKLLAERDQLRATQKKLRENSVADPVNDDSDNDPTGTIVRLRGEVKALDLKIADAKARTQAADTKERDLAARLQQLKSETADIESKQVEHVRFPKERRTSKLNANVVLQFGEIFPLHDAEGKDFAGVTHDPPNSDRFKAIPQKSRGWTLAQNRRQIAEVITEYKRAGRYIAFYIYPDSFETFRSLKELIYNGEVDYGLEILPADYIIQFVPDGVSPAPL